MKMDHTYANNTKFCNNLKSRLKMYPCSSQLEHKKVSIFLDKKDKYLAAIAARDSSQSLVKGTLQKSA